MNSLEATIDNMHFLLAAKDIYMQQSPDHTRHSVTKYRLMQFKRRWNILLATFAHSWEEKLLEEPNTGSLNQY